MSQRNSNIKYGFNNMKSALRKSKQKNFVREIALEKLIKAIKRFKNNSSNRYFVK